MMRWYTSTEAAAICGLAPATIRRWIRGGRLQAHRTPGGNIRILHEHLVEFMRQFGIPGDLGGETRGAGFLLHTEHARTRAALLAALDRRGGDLRVIPVDSHAALWYLLGRTRPRFVVTEASLATQGIERCEQIRACLAPQVARIGLCVNESGVLNDGAGAGPEVVARPDTEADWAAAFLSRLLGQGPLTALLEAAEQVA